MKYTDAQMAVWLRGLLSVAWADGSYDSSEQALILQMAHDLQLGDKDVLYESISPEDLAAVLGGEGTTGENFLRTAVLVSIADGVYSQPEADLIYKYGEALGLNIEALQGLEHTLCDHHEEAVSPARQDLVSPPHPHPDVLYPLKDWLDDLEIHDPRLARFLCKMIPPQCPFERDIVLFGHKILHIPPLCKLNPLYEQLVGLRFRSLSYLAEDCKEDISPYI
ncbi:MAG: hypothetical protein N5P05_000794 [Chroococcopsis gigantea SAG 12.99]|jgi:tellurite resistance protein|nr:nitrogenase [Chlorogloea purpurea SAG 13.99]MDV2999188.1 hypothetical protein [Chroococcopsis gigantea SAG 12.99]